MHLHKKLHEDCKSKGPRFHPLPELSSEFFWQQESSVHISEMSQKCCLYAHFEWLTGPALRDVISDEVAGDKVSMHAQVLLNENIMFIAMISCRLWLYTDPVVANFFSTFFLATDRYNGQFRGGLRHGQGIVCCQNFD